MLILSIMFAIYGEGYNLNEVIENVSLYLRVYLYSSRHVSLNQSTAAKHTLTS